jgi:hypothetical protein
MSEDAGNVAGPPPSASKPRLVAWAAMFLTSASRILRRGAMIALGVADALFAHGARNIHLQYHRLDTRDDMSDGEPQE